MRTNGLRRGANRCGLQYPSDLIDAEWALTELLIPLAKHGGRKRTVNMREVLNGIICALSTERQWNAIPKGLPPMKTSISMDGPHV